MAGIPHVRDSWRAVDDDSWIVGDRILLSRHFVEPSATGSTLFWSDGNGAFYTVSEHTPSSTVHRESPAVHPFPKVYDAGDQHVVWQVGNAFLKIRHSDPQSTLEHVTLAAVHDMYPDRNFAIPDVLFHGEWDGRDYLLLTKVPGKTLHEAWPMMSDVQKEDCLAGVAAICKRLAEKKGSQIAGVDGNPLGEGLLTLSEDDDYSPENLLRNCRGLGMDCESGFVFYHCDLGPGNVLVDLENGGALGIIDWELAGYVPREWIRTKFRIGSGLDFNFPGDQMGARIEWRKRMQQTLERDGFADVLSAWMDWWFESDTGKVR